MSAALAESPLLETLADPRVKQKLQEVRQTDNVTNLGYLLGNYLYLGAVIVGTLAFYHFQVANEWSWWWTVPVTILAIILVGAGQHQLTGLAHEASHHTLLHHRYANDLVSDLFCMFPLFSSTQHYRLQHLAHHQFVNDPDRDPDISQLKTSGHWLDFPVEKAVFVGTLLKQLWIPNLFRYMRIRAAYNAVPSDKNPYLKKDWKPSRITIRIGIAYMVTLIAVLAGLVYFEQPLALAIVPTIMYLAMMTFYARIPDDMYHQSRVHPVISMRFMTYLRITYITAVFVGLAWLSLLVNPYSAAYFILLWLVPIFTSFSFFMILRQLVQHGNGDRGWLNNTRVFHVNPFLRFAVFPHGQDYHLPHHIFASVPHYRLKELHQFLTKVKEYRDQAIEVEGYFMPLEKPQVKPTVLDVVGPHYFHKAAEIYIDNTVLEGEKVEEKDEILRQGEEEKQRRRDDRTLSPAGMAPSPSKGEGWGGGVRTVGDSIDC